MIFKICYGEKKNKVQNNVYKIKKQKFIDFIHSLNVEGPPRS